MPFEGIMQPKIIEIDGQIRLKAFDGNFAIAYAWYQDPIVYKNSEGRDEPVDLAYIEKMYHYLDSVGELYFIEILVDGSYQAIGDITVKAVNPPIVIGDSNYRGKGIGKKVMQAMIARAKELNFEKICDSEVYDYNLESIKLHESLGFKPTGKKDNTWFYELKLF